MIAYKGFNKDLTCRDYQFSENKIHTTKEANCVQNGFHCAENPLDCLTYYPKWDDAVYYIVYAGGDIDEDATDSKISCTKMKLIKKLTLEEFVYASVVYMVHHPMMEISRLVDDDEISRNTLHRDKFKIVRGKNPQAAGEIGTVIGLAKEWSDSKYIEEISIITIDGTRYLPGVFYRVDGTEGSGTI